MLNLKHIINIELYHTTISNSIRDNLRPVSSLLGRIRHLNYVDDGRNECWNLKHKIL